MAWKRKSKRIVADESEPFVQLRGVNGEVSARLTNPR